MTAQTLFPETMSIRQMCDAFDVTPRTLRFYEAKELLFPQRIGTRRLFTRRDRARMTLIARFKRFGISLENIRLILDTYDQTKSEQAQLRVALGFAKERLAEVEAEHAKMATVLDELRSEIETAETALVDQPTGSKHAQRS